MENLIKYLGKKAGQTVKKSKWIYDSVLGDEDDVIKSEYQFGLYMAKDIQSTQKIYRSKFLDAIGKKLAARVNTNHKFTFILLESDDVNAFALPGGFIFLNRGIIEFCKHDEDQLAFILSHEMAHVIKGHSFNRLIAEYSINTISRFIKVTGLLQQAAKQLTVKYLQTLYSRDNELEADEFAVRLMTAANYNTEVAVKFFENMNIYKKDGTFLPEYFSTHPTFDERIAIVDKSNR